jgi:hypothetical protein
MTASMKVSKAVMDEADPDDPVDLTLTLQIATFERDRTDLTRGQEILGAVGWVLASQPNSGLTMTVEDSGRPVPELVGALEAVGAHEHARLLREAAVVSDPGELDDAWDEADGDASRLAALMWTYVTDHESEFFT